jgi:lysophospholipase L1-like esterase
MPVMQGEVIFLGNSITDGAEWSELFNSTTVLNRGISGDRTLGILNRLDEVTKRKPSKLFLLIGTNDLAGDILVQDVVDNTLLIAQIVKKESPGTKLYIQSILPVSDHYHLFGSHTRNGKKILAVNKALQENADFCR